MLGVLPTAQALALAVGQGLDLVEISPGAVPPVCRIMDFGKYRYEEKRKEREARKRQHSLALKEIKFHANVEEHDYRTKVNSVRKFLAKGHKVKISLFFRGRENVHPELGYQLLKRVVKDCEDIGAIDTPPKQIGRGIFGILSQRSLKHGKGSVPALPQAAADEPVDSREDVAEKVQEVGEGRQSQN